MKAKLICSVLFIGFATSSLTAQSWLKGSISGKGEIVKKEIQVDRFDGVSLAFSGDIILTQGSVRHVVVEAQENIIENIKTDVKNGVWKVRYDKNVRRAKPVKVFITVPDLTYVGVSGSGDIRTDGHFANQGDLDIRLSGSGNIRMDVDAGNVVSSISGSGSITLKGNGNENEIRISGSGDVYGADFRVENCTVAISGSGDVEAHVTGDLDARISGSGDVRYLGDCNVKARISGSGNVREK